MLLMANLKYSTELISITLAIVNYPRELERLSKCTAYIYFPMNIYTSHVYFTYINPQVQESQVTKHILIWLFKIRKINKYNSQRKKRHITFAGKKNVRRILV